jgi:hypothetical protein
MSRGILLEMENICGNTERRATFLWWSPRKPQLLGEAEETTHSASRRVPEKIPKCFVTVNIRAKFFRTRGSASSSSLFDPFGVCAEAEFGDRRRDVAGLCGARRVRGGRQNFEEQLRLPQDDICPSFGVNGAADDAPVVTRAPSGLEHRAPF